MEFGTGKIKSANHHQELIEKVMGQVSNLEQSEAFIVLQCALNRTLPILPVNRVHVRYMQASGEIQQASFVVTAIDQEGKP